MKEASLLLLAAVGSLAGCSGHPAVSAQRLPTVVTVVARDYGYELPKSIPAGVTTIRLVNQGKELHHMQIVRLDQGKSAADFFAEMTHEGPLPAWAVPVGGPNAAEPGATVSETQQLAPGNYAVMCMIPGADGKPHFTRGMTGSFEVTKSTAPAATEPAADLVVSLVDYNFSVAGDIKPGSHTLRVENKGTQPHEAVLVRLESGKTLGDLLNWVEHPDQGPPPAHFIGGLVGLAPGDHAFFGANFTPGIYGWLCFLPDVKDGKPHLMHGMMTQFIVGSPS